MAESNSNAPQADEHTEPTEHQVETESPETPPEGGVSDSGVSEQPEHEAAPDPETDEDQFSRLMRERREGKADPAPQAPEPEPEPEPQPETEQVEPEAAGEPPETDATDDQGQEADWYQALPEEARQQIVQQEQYTQQLYQNYQALQGRLAPMQRLVEDLRKQLREKEAAPAPTLDDLEKHHAWKDISQELPEEAGELKQVFTSQAAAIQEAQARQQQLNKALEQERQERLSTEMRRLSVRHPNVMTVRNHPLFTQWRQAIQANPQGYPQVAQKLNSPYYEDTSDVLDAFKADLQQAYPDAYAQLYPTAPRQQQPQGQQQGTPQQQARPQGRTPSRPKPPNPSPPSQGSGISGARRQQAPMTDEEAFSAHLRSKQRR